MRNNLGHGGARRGAGRKTIEPDLIELEKLCSLLCRHGELANPSSSRLRSKTS